MLMHRLGLAAAGLACLCLLGCASDVERGPSGFAGVPTSTDLPDTAPHDNGLATGVRHVNDGAGPARVSPASPPSSIAEPPQNAPAMRAPVATAPAAGRQIMTLGEGDVIEFRMFGQPDMTTTGSVSAAGTLSLPLLQQVQVGGLSLSQAQQKIAQAYKDGGYFNDPQVNITIATYRSQQISVLGQVREPGRYPLETRTGLLDALAEARGITAQGAHTVVVIRHDDGRDSRSSQRFRLNVDALVAGQEDPNGFSLQAGDTVFVPEAPLFYIYGEVRQPNGYALQPGMTVMQAISTGGGLTERGSNSRITLHRKMNGTTVEVDPKLSDAVQPGDVLFVKERIF